MLQRILSVLRDEFYQTQCSTMKDYELIKWIRDRLVHVHHESPNVDYIHRLNSISKELRRINR